MNRVVKLNALALLIGFLVFGASILGGYAAGYFFIGIWVSAFFGFLLFVKIQKPSSQLKHHIAYICGSGLLYSLVFVFALKAWTYGSVNCAAASLVGYSVSRHCDSSGCTCIIR